MATLRPIFRGLAAFAALSFMALGVFLALLFYERSSGVELPTPTGPFAVGREIYDWRDDATVDGLAPPPGTKREILAWIWFPAAIGQLPTTDDYFPANLREALGPTPFPIRFVYRDPSKVRAHSVRNASMSPGRSYPV